MAPSAGSCPAGGAANTTGTCVRRLGAPGASAARTRPVRGPADLPAAPSQCDFGSPPYRANPDRFTSCSDTVWELYTYDTNNGIVSITGALDVVDQQWTSYSHDSLTWTHGLNLTVDYGATGTLANGTTATIVSDCDNNPTCAVSATLGQPDGQPVQLVPGNGFSNAWTEYDTGPAAGSSGEESIQDLLGVAFAGPGATGTPWTFQDGYLTGRCDSITGSTDGCVNPDFIPTLTYSLARYGSSAAMIQWAQQNLSAKWGVPGQGKPLHRLLNSSEARKNRRVVCDSTYTEDASMTAALAPYADQDTCDEFPFASTYESAALDGHTTSGAECAQTTAEQISAPTGTDEAADWPTVRTTSTPTGTEPCVRGHIPGNLNSGTGGGYSAFIQSVRLVDEDAFWVAVTA